MSTDLQICLICSLLILVTIGNMILGIFNISTIKNEVVPGIEGYEETRRSFNDTVVKIATNQSFQTLMADMANTRKTVNDMYVDLESIYAANAGIEGNISADITSCRLHITNFTEELVHVNKSVENAILELKLTLNFTSSLIYVLQQEKQELFDEIDSLKKDFAAQTELLNKAEERLETIKNNCTCDHYNIAQWTLIGIDFVILLIMAITACRRS